MGIIGTSCTINCVLFIYLFIQLYLHLSKGENPGMQLPPPKNRNFKNAYYVDIMISNILRGLPFSKNQLLE